MPQFDTSAYISQLFWLAITFSVVFFALYKNALPRIAEIFAVRSDKIEGQNQAGTDMKEEAKKILESIEHELEVAQQDSNARISAAIHGMNLNVSQRKSEFLSIQKRRIKASEKTIQRKKAEAYDEVKSIALLASQQMVTVLSGMDIPNDSAERVLNMVIDENNLFSHNDDLEKVSNAS